MSILDRITGLELLGILLALLAAYLAVRALRERRRQAPGPSATKAIHQTGSQEPAARLPCTAGEGIAAETGADGVPPVSESLAFPEEVVAALAVHLRFSADPALQAPGAAIPGSVVAAIALSLAEYADAPWQAPHTEGRLHPTSLPSPWPAPESPWKILGRQESLSRNHPWTGYGRPQGR